MSRGFRSEDTHITNLGCLEKNNGSYRCWLCLVSQSRRVEVKFKTDYLVKIQQAKPASTLIFRYGLDFIREIIISPFNRLTLFKPYFQLLLPLNEVHL